MGHPARASAEAHHEQAALLTMGIPPSRIHRARRDEFGEILQKGHNDLVSEHLGPAVGAAYKMLFTQAQDIRYRPFFRKFTDPRHALNEVRLSRVQLEVVNRACAKS